MHYIFFTGGSSNELFDRMFSDLNKDERVSMVSDLPRHDHKTLYKLHHARSLNRKHPAPFRYVWESSRMEAIVRLEADKHKDLCIVFNNFSLPYFEPSQIRAWKRRYGVKLVLCFIDRLSSYFAAEALMYEKNIPFDRVYSYYRADAKSAGYKYFDCYYSKQELPVTDEKCGVYFWGSDTGRRKMLESVYNRCTQLGVSVKMGICYAQGGEPYIDGIEYDRPKTYDEMLKDIAGAGVLLDVITGDGGVSLRYYEALAYGKKLISNNPRIKDMRGYDPQSMLYIEKAQDIDIDIFRRDTGRKPYSGELSPVHWVDELDRQLL